MLNGSTEVGPGVLCSVCLSVRHTFAGPGGPPEAGPRLERRQDLGPKWLGGNGDVPDLHHPPAPPAKRAAGSEL